MNLSLKDTAVTLLSQQLRYLQHHRTDFLNSYFREDNAEKLNADRVLSVYSMIVEQLLEGSASDLMDSYALVGSRVELDLDIDSREPVSGTFSLVFPHHVDGGNNRISFLSPVGIQVLLSKKGDYLTIDAPGKVYRGFVRNVAYTGEGAVI